MYTEIYSIDPVNGEIVCHLGDSMSHKQVKDNIRMLDKKYPGHRFLIGSSITARKVCKCGKLFAAYYDKLYTCGDCT
jgi:hypothetical protein